VAPGRTESDREDTKEFLAAQYLSGDAPGDKNSKSPEKSKILIPHHTKSKQVQKAQQTQSQQSQLQRPQSKQTQPPQTKPTPPRQQVQKEQLKPETNIRTPESIEQNKIVQQPSQTTVPSQTQEHHKQEIPNISREEVKLIPTKSQDQPVLEQLSDVKAQPQRTRGQPSQKPTRQF